MRAGGDAKRGDKTEWESKTPLHLDYLCLNFLQYHLLTHQEVGGDVLCWTGL